MTTVGTGAGTGAGAGAGAGVGAGVGGTSPAATTSESFFKTGYLVNVPLYYGGAKDKVAEKVSYIYDSILGNPTFQTGRNFKVLIGLNRKVGSSSSDSFELVQARLDEKIAEGDKPVVEYALVRYEWSPIEDRPVDGAINYTAVRNLLFSHKKNDEFYEAFKNERVNHIYYLAMDPDTQLNKSILDRVEIHFLAKKRPIIVAGHYQFKVENKTLIQASNPPGIQANDSINWPGFLTSIHTTFDQGLKEELAGIKLGEFFEGGLDKTIDQSDYIGVSRNIRILSHILGSKSLSVDEENLCNMCLADHQVLEGYQRSVQQSILLCRSYLTQLENIDSEHADYFKDILSVLPKPNRWEKVLEKDVFKPFEWNHEDLQGLMQQVLDEMIQLSNSGSYGHSLKKSQLVQKIRSESQSVLDSLNAIAEFTSLVNNLLSLLSRPTCLMTAPIKIDGKDILYPPEPAIFVKFYQRLSEFARIATCFITNTRVAAPDVAACFIACATDTAAANAAANAVSIAVYNAAAATFTGAFEDAFESAFIDADGDAANVDVVFDIIDGFRKTVRDVVRDVVRDADVVIVRDVDIVAIKVANTVHAHAHATVPYAINTFVALSKRKTEFFKFLRKRNVSIWGGKGSNHTDEGEALCATLKSAWEEFQLRVRDSSPFSIDYGFKYETEPPERVFKSLSPGRAVDVLLGILIGRLTEIKESSSGNVRQQVAKAFNEQSGDLVDALMKLQEEVSQSSIKEKFLVQRGRYIARISKHEGGYKEGIIPLEYVNDIYVILKGEYSKLRNTRLKAIKKKLLRLLSQEVLAVVLDN